jgi:peptide/nickel transport system substrate-binding protein
VTDERTGSLGLRLPLNRRAVLRASALGAGGLAAAALIGCGGDEETEDTASTAPAASGGAPAATGEGKLVKDADQPYPYAFPEPAGKTPKDGGTMIVGVSWEVATMDPTKSAAGGTITVPNVSYERLLEWVQGPKADPFKVEMRPGLAASWERSPDGLTYTFKIRPGVKWHNVAPMNGRPFVAADAKFAYERYAKEGVHQSLWTELDKIEAPDEATLKFTLKRPLVDFITPLAGRYQTIFPKELVDSGEIEKKVVGTGAMVFKEAKTGQEVLFDKNPDYWQGKVHLNAFTFRIMPDLQARLAAFRAGQLDYAYGLTSKLSETQAVEKSNPGVQISQTAPTQGGYGFGMNLQNPKFKDERVRRAIALSMDHQTTVQLLFEGSGVVLPNSPWAFHLTKAPDYKKGELGAYTKAQGDPTEAKKLLEAAGVKDLKIDATYYTYAGQDSTRPELMTDQFRKSGITLNAKKVDYTEFNSQWVGGKLAEATTSGWAAVGFDADNYFYNQVYSKSPGNRWHIEDTQIDEWALAQRFELNPEKRKELMKKIWDRDLDMVFRIPQAGPTAFDILQPWLRGWRSSGPLGTTSYYYDWGAQLHSVWLDK